MKISKLFHWLYGILMLLPILVFIPNAFYYGFNEQAVAQEKTEQVPIYYETNEVNTYNDLQVGNIYYWTDNIDFSVQGGNFGIYINPDLFSNYVNNAGTITEAYIYARTLDNYVYYYVRYIVNNNYYYRISDQPMDFIIESISNVQNIPNDFISRVTTSDKKIVKEYQPLTTNMSITDSMSYAWDSVWQNDLFSWSYVSFLAEPFKYIGNVFGLPSDNSIYYCLSYWLDISIIWLCFDLIMYVPLLVHRWIDKGVLE